MSPSFTLPTQKHIPQNKAHSSGKTRKQQPEQKPTAPRRHGQVQQPAASQKDQEQQAIAQAQVVQRLTSYVPGEALVLAAEAIERQTNQPDSRQQPQADRQEAGVKGISQPKQKLSQTASGEAGHLQQSEAGGASKDEAQAAWPIKNQPTSV